MVSPPSDLAQGPPVPAPVAAAEEDDESPAAAGEAPAEPAATLTGRESLPLQVLVIDDSPDIREMLSDYLQREGCRVAVASSAREALLHLEQASFHVTIVDLLLPDANGLDLLPRIRERSRDISIIILTAHATIQTAAASIRLNILAYLEKPAVLSDLRGLLEQVARQRGLLRRPEAEVLKIIGENIHQRRRTLGRTLRDLSNQTGLSVSMLSQIERATTSMSVGTLVRLAYALGLEVTDLMDRLKLKS